MRARRSCAKGLTTFRFCPLPAFSWILLAKWAPRVVKGLRAMTDFEYELQQADLNYRLDADLESIFVMSSPQYGYLSSSVVRQIASFGGDVSEFVTPNVDAALKERFKER